MTALPRTADVGWSGGPVSAAMMSIWSHRPQTLYLVLFFGAYVLGCGFAKVLAIVPGITVSIWPPGGVFIATLILTSPYSWPWWILAGCLAEMFGQLVWFHSPWVAGFLIFVGNALGASVGAFLVNRVCGRPVRLETLREVLGFVVLGAGIGPLVSATVGSATLAWFGVKQQTFTQVWPLFFIGDATGVLLVAPLALVALQQWRSIAHLTAPQWLEASVLGLIFLGVAALSMSSHYLPFAYIIMPPLLWAAVRFEFKGVAIALTLLTLITAALTMSGSSQFVGDAESQRQKQVMLQLFLVISAFSALIVAAISRQNQLAMLTLSERERQLHQLVNAVPAAVWSITPEGKPTYVNKRFTDVIGATVQDITAPDGSPALSAIIHPEDIGATMASIRQSLAAGTPYVMRYRQIRRDGSYRWTETRAEPLRNESGAILQWYGVTVDIDDLVKAQDALRQSEHELLQLVNMVPVYIRRLTPEGEPIFFNKRLTDFIGVDLAHIAAPGMNRLPPAVENFVHPDESAALLASIRHSVATGEGYAMRYRMRRADGVYRWLETRAEAVRHPDGTIAQWYVVSIDVDDQVRAQLAEEALRETSDKLAKATQSASLAELSASIAHEVNQPLAAIVANSHACQRWLAAEPPNVDRAKITADRIIRDANSAADVVSRIRALFKQSLEPKNSTTFSSIITEARNLMAEDAARRRVRVDVDVDSNLPLVAFDRVQIQQVLINLMRNGIDAMESVATDRVLRVCVRQNGDFVQGEVIDLGQGVQFPDKIFEPFFTTKENGMGMGLAICRSIIESHGGRLWTEQNKYGGATFIFTLPVEVKSAS